VQIAGGEESSALILPSPWFKSVRTTPIMGASLEQTLAAVILAEPELFDRAVLMHSLIPWTSAPAPGLRGREILIAAGRRDPICPLPLTNGLAAYLEGQGARVELALHDGGHEIRQVELAGITRFLQREAVAPA
jgi:phospholipase/carboxylesterase